MQQSAELAGLEAPKSSKQVRNLYYGRGNRRKYTFVKKFLLWWSIKRKTMGEYEENGAKKPIKCHNNMSREEIRIQGRSDWIEVRASEERDIERAEINLIPLGITFNIPDGCKPVVKTEENIFSVLGMFFPEYPGEELIMPVMANRDMHLCKNDLICRFQLTVNHPIIRVCSDEVSEDSPSKI